MATKKKVSPVRVISGPEIKDQPPVVLELTLSPLDVRGLNHAVQNYGSFSAGFESELVEALGPYLLNANNEDDDY